jgi:phosphate uptake regulator
MADTPTREQLEKQLDELSSKYIRGDKEVAKQIIELHRRIEEMKKNEDAG